MRNHHNRLTPVKLVQVFHDFFFIVGIQRVGGFIEKDKFGVLIHGAGDQDTLTLSLKGKYYELVRNQLELGR